MAELAETSLRRWQCSDGCLHLVEREGRPRRYDCTYWLNFAPTLSGSPTIPQPCGILTEKRIHGPHTDEPTLECPHFFRPDQSGRG